MNIENILNSILKKYDTSVKLLLLKWGKDEKIKTDFDQINFYSSLIIRERLKHKTKKINFQNSEFFQQFCYNRFLDINEKYWITEIFSDEDKIYIKFIGNWVEQKKKIKYFDATFFYERKNFLVNLKKHYEIFLTSIRRQKNFIGYILKKEESHLLFVEEFTKKELPSLTDKKIDLIATLLNKLSSSIPLNPNDIKNEFNDSKQSTTTNSENVDFPKDNPFKTNKKILKQLGKLIDKKYTKKDKKEIDETIKNMVNSAITNFQTQFDENLKNISQLPSKKDYQEQLNKISNLEFEHEEIKKSIKTKQKQSTKGWGQDTKDLLKQLFAKNKQNEKDMNSIKNLFDNKLNSLSKACKCDQPKAKVSCCDDHNTLKSSVSDIFSKLSEAIKNQNTNMESLKSGLDSISSTTNFQGSQIYSLTDLVKNTLMGSVSNLNAKEFITKQAIEFLMAKVVEITADSGLFKYNLNLFKEKVENYLSDMGLYDNRTLSSQINDILDKIKKNEDLTNEQVDKIKENMKNMKNEVSANKELIKTNLDINVANFETAKEIITNIKKEMDLKYEAKFQEVTAFFSSKFESLPNLRAEEQKKVKNDFQKEIENIKNEIEIERKNKIKKITDNFDQQTNELNEKLKDILEKQKEIENEVKIKIPSKIEDQQISDISLNNILENVKNKFSFFDKEKENKINQRIEQIELYKNKLENIDLLESLFSEKFASQEQLIELRDRVGTMEISQPLLKLITKKFGDLIRDDKANKEKFEKIEDDIKKIGDKNFTQKRQNFLKSILTNQTSTNKIKKEIKELKLQKNVLLKKINQLSKNKSKISKKQIIDNKNKIFELNEKIKDLKTKTEIISNTKEVDYEGEKFKEKVKERVKIEIPQFVDFDEMRNELNITIENVKREIQLEKKTDFESYKKDLEYHLKNKFEWESTQQMLNNVYAEMADQDDTIRRYQSLQKMLTNMPEVKGLITQFEESKRLYDLRKQNFENSEIYNTLRRKISTVHEWGYTIDSRIKDLQEQKDQLEKLITSNTQKTQEQIKTEINNVKSTLISEIGKTIQTKETQLTSHLNTLKRELDVTIIDIKKMKKDLPKTFQEEINIIKNKVAELDDLRDLIDTQKHEFNEFIKSKNIPDNLNNKLQALWSSIGEIKNSNELQFVKEEIEEFKETLPKKIAFEVSKTIKEINTVNKTEADLLKSKIDGFEKQLSLQGRQMLKNNIDLIKRLAKFDTLRELFYEISLAPFFQQEFINNFEVAKMEAIITIKNKINYIRDLTQQQKIEEGRQTQEFLKDVKLIKQLEAIKILLPEWKREYATIEYLALLEYRLKNWETVNEVKRSIGTSKPKAYALYKKLSPYFQGIHYMKLSYFFSTTPDQIDKHINILRDSLAKKHDMNITKARNIFEIGKKIQSHKEEIIEKFLNDKILMFNNMLRSFGAYKFKNKALNAFFANNKQVLGNLFENLKILILNIDQSSESISSIYTELDNLSKKELSMYIFIQMLEDFKLEFQKIVLNSKIDDTKKTYAIDHLNNSISLLKKFENLNIKDFELIASSISDTITSLITIAIQIPEYEQNIAQDTSSLYSLFFNVYEEHPKKSKLEQIDYFNQEFWGKINKLREVEHKLNTIYNFRERDSLLNTLEINSLKKLNKFKNFEIFFANLTSKLLFDNLIQTFTLNIILNDDTEKKYFIDNPLIQGWNDRQNINILKWVENKNIKKIDINVLGEEKINPISFGDIDLHFLMDIFQMINFMDLPSILQDFFHKQTFDLQNLKFFEKLLTMIDKIDISSFFEFIIDGKQNFDRSTNINYIKQNITSGFALIVGLFTAGNSWLLSKTSWVFKKLKFPELVFYTSAQDEPEKINLINSIEHLAKKNIEMIKEKIDEIDNPFELAFLSHIINIEQKSPSYTLPTLIYEIYKISLMWELLKYNIDKTMLNFWGNYIETIKLLFSKLISFRLCISVAEEMSEYDITYLFRSTHEQRFLGD